MRISAILPLVIAITVASVPVSITFASGGGHDSHAAKDDGHGAKKEDGHGGGHDSHGKEEAVEEPKGPVYEREWARVEHLPEGEYQPWRIIRDLQIAQDRIVAGEKDSIKSYQILLLRSGKWLHELDDHAWQYERNLDAIAIYLLLGGDVELGYKSLKKSHLENSSKILLKGALAYAERDNYTAYQLLTKVNHKTLPPSIAGQVAIAKSMIYSSNDLNKSYELLFEARLLAPGTLVEEAAIRRAIRVAVELDRFEDLKSLQRFYLNQFSASWYFPDFLRNISHGLLSVTEEHHEEILPELKYLMTRVETQHQLQLAEYVARKAVVNGLFEIARWAANKGLALAEPGSKLATRLALYNAASDVADEHRVAEIVDLTDTMQKQHLSAPDMKIFEAIRIVSKGITREPQEEALAMLKRHQAGTQDYEEIIAQSNGEDKYAITDKEREAFRQELPQTAKLKNLNYKFEQIMQGIVQ